MTASIMFSRTDTCGLPCIHLLPIRTRRTCLVLGNVSAYQNKDGHLLSLVRRGLVYQVPSRLICGSLDRGCFRFVIHPHQAYKFKERKLANNVYTTGEVVRLQLTHSISGLTHFPPNEHLA